MSSRRRYASRFTNSGHHAITTTAALNPNANSSTLHQPLARPFFLSRSMLIMPFAWQVDDVIGVAMNGAMNRQGFYLIGQRGRSLRCAACACATALGPASCCTTHVLATHIASPCVCQSAVCALASFTLLVTAGPGAAVATRLAFSCTVRCFCFVQEKPSAKPKARRGQSLQGRAERVGRSRKTHRQPHGKHSNLAEFAVK